jgi:3-polyprenyl-4-hydroxybenzoate decarboxylase
MKAGRESPGRSPINFLWSTFTRFDPARDIVAARTELVGTQAVRHPPLVIDARRKAGYPEELFCDEETARQVDGRWKDYFDRPVEMGDSDRASLD